jgi:hypothetical protein
MAGLTGAAAAGLGGYMKATGEGDQKLADILVIAGSVVAVAAAATGLVGVTRNIYRSSIKTRAINTSAGGYYHTGTADHRTVDLVKDLMTTRRTPIREPIRKPITGPKKRGERQWQQ